MKVSETLTWLVVLFSISIPARPQEGRNFIEVTFTNSVSLDQARWLLQSYGAEGEIVEKRANYAVLIGKNRSAEEGVVRKLIEHTKLGEFGRSSLVPHSLMAQQGIQLTLYGEICTNELYQNRLVSLASPEVTIKWDLEPSYAVVPLSQSNSDLPSLLLEDKWISRVKTENVPSKAALQSSVVVINDLVVNNSKERTHAAQHAPSESATQYRGLPDKRLVVSVLEKQYHITQTEIEVINEEQYPQSNFLGVVVHHIKGRITTPPYWERLEFFIPVITTSPNEILIRCLLDGQYAAGVSEPAEGNFKDLEPEYSRSLQESADLFVQNLADALKKKSSR